MERRFRCAACGHEWDVPHGIARPEECPSCKSKDLHRFDAERGFRGRGPRMGFGRGNGRRNIRERRLRQPAGD